MATSALVKVVYKICTSYQNQLSAGLDPGLAIDTHSFGFILKESIKNIPFSQRKPSSQSEQEL
jgi:hypothetical protein